MISGSRVVEAAREYLGVPYQHQGRTSSGIDCIGVAIAVAHDLGLTDYDIKTYSRSPARSMMGAILADKCKKFHVEQMQPGDLLWMAYERQPQHIAILTSLVPKCILHADSLAGRVVEHRLDRQWQRRIRGVFRMPGVE